MKRIIYKNETMKKPYKINILRRIKKYLFYVLAIILYMLGFNKKYLNLFKTIHKFIKNKLFNN